MGFDGERARAFARLEIYGRYDIFRISRDTNYADG